MSNQIVAKYRNFPLIDKVANMMLDIEDTFLFLYLTWRTVSGSENTPLGKIGDIMFNKSVRGIMYIQKIVNKENELLQQNLIEVVPESFFHDSQLKLTDHSLTIIQEAGIKLFGKNRKSQDIIEPATIPVRPMFYNPENQKELDLLGNLLQENKLKAIQQRLMEKKLPKGVVILLYGPPGTGKTETVFQLARKTNREVIKVDISKSKSFWFGESEKITKKIFTDYRSYTRYCNLTPILLFNEADGIITKRIDRSHPGGHQTENAIQNIILEELENFEGIFIATTNLAKNLDHAFERRFLFKIRLDKPIIPIKTKIWQLKLPHLSHAECEMLATSFDLSGGQIDNVVRKFAMHEIIYGTTLSVEEIAELCKKEQFAKNNRNKIGYLKN